MLDLNLKKERTLSLAVENIDISQDKKSRLAKNLLNYDKYE